MPEPTRRPQARSVRRVALHALLAGSVITVLKFGVFLLTDSVAVLSDAMESIINVAAAAVMLTALWYADRPADRSHPYGHGKAEFLAVGLEGWLILIAGVSIGVEAVRRLVSPEPVQNLYEGVWALGGVAILSGALATYVWWMGRRHASDVLIADGKHLATDVASTLAVMGGLLLIRWTDRLWLDSVVAIAVAGVILFVSWRLLWHSLGGLMDRSDPADDAIIQGILDEEVASGEIQGYHKVRHRHQGAWHWVDMHLQVDGSWSVDRGHEVASRIEGRIERALGEGNATAHVEPWEEATK